MADKVRYIEVRNGQIRIWFNDSGVALSGNGKRASLIVSDAIKGLRVAIGKHKRELDDCEAALRAMERQWPEVVK